jgi:hypothetical protein
MNNEIHELSISELDIVIGGSIFGTPGGPGPGTGPYAPFGPITIHLPTEPKPTPIFPV